MTPRGMTPQAAARLPVLAALLALFVTLAGMAALAVEPSEMLADPALEARAREIGREIRCLVCQNQSIDDSAADLARDLRLLIRERLVAGDSDEAVRDFLVARYGDFVLLDPPVRPRTWGLWFGPAAILVIAALGVALYFRRRRAVAPPAPLTPEEASRVRRLIEEERLP